MVEKQDESKRTVGSTSSSSGVCNPVKKKKDLFFFLFLFSCMHLFLMLNVYFVHGKKG